jgi:hypothetical protein
VAKIKRDCTAAQQKLAAKVAALQYPEERAAVVAARARWDAEWAQLRREVPALSTPSSHMVCRSIVQTALIGKLKKENELRLGGHNLGPAPLLLGAGRCHEGNHSGHQRLCGEVR